MKENIKIESISDYCQLYQNIQPMSDILKDRLEQVSSQIVKKNEAHIGLNADEKLIVHFVEYAGQNEYIYSEKCY